MNCPCGGSDRRPFPRGAASEPDLRARGVRTQQVAAAARREGVDPGHEPLVMQREPSERGHVRNGERHRPRTGRHFRELGRDEQQAPRRLQDVSARGDRERQRHAARGGAREPGREDRDARAALGRPAARARRIAHGVADAEDGEDPGLATALPG